MSSRRQDAGAARSLTGPTLTSAPPVRRIDENLLGQVDAVEAGEVSGWACLRGAISVQPLQVSWPFACLPRHHAEVSGPAPFLLAV